jgi:HD-like signal output (HDOD) protein
MGRLLGQADSEDLFAAALLQDMAVPLLAKELPEDYNKLFNGRHGGRTRLSELEMERFGWTHAEAAGIMARRWSLPETFADLIEIHASFEELVANGATAGQVAVSLSALLPSVQDSGWFEREQFVDAFRRLTHKETSDLSAMFVEIDAGFEEFAPVLKLSTPAQSLEASLEPEEAPTT